MSGHRAAEEREHYFHVTSSLNRDSIAEHGLDWRRMSAARGIAGSEEAEQRGCFLCRDEWERDWFIRLNNTGGTVDVWLVTGVDGNELVESPEGHFFVPRPVPPADVRLVMKDILGGWDDAGR